MKTMNIGALVLDPKLQSRAEINEDTVTEYAEAIEAGDQFPPVEVTFDGIHYYLTDGYHRYHAHKRAGKVSIACDVVNGTFRDAVLRATAVNSKHGMRRTWADKRKAVMTLLEDFEWSQWSNSEIARQCGVSAPFVANLRNAGEKPASEKVKYKTKTGEVKEKAKAAGRKAKEEPLQAPAPEPQQEQHDERREAIDMLIKENEDLKDRLAVAAMDGTEEEKALAKETIDDLREKVRVLEIELTAVKTSRDTFQSENAQLKKQVSMLQRKLKQAGEQ